MLVGRARFEVAISSIQSYFFKTSGLIQVIGAFPLSTAKTLSVTIFPIASRVSRVAEAICGTITTLSS